MRRLKNIAKNLEAIFRKREGEQTLNLQSLEERVLYSAVPLPVDLADNLVESPEQPPVEELIPDTVSDNVSSTLDQLDALIDDNETPELSSTVSTEPFPSSNFESSEYEDQDNTVDPGDSTQPLGDIPVAANIRVAVNQGGFSTQTIDEGDVLLISDVSLNAGGLQGQTIVVSSLTPGGTIYQEGQALAVGDTVSVDALQDGDVLFIPDLNFTGQFAAGFERISGGDASDPPFYGLSVVLSGVADDGVAVVGDGLTVIGPLTEVVPSGTDSDIVALADGGYVIVWTSTESDPDDRTINVQRYDADGSPRGNSSEFRNGNGTFVSSIAALADGGFIVAFQDDAGVGADIFLSRFDANGDPVEQDGTSTNSPDPERFTPSSLEQILPSVVGTDDGGYAVVYLSEDGDSRSGELDLVIRLFDGFGDTGEEIQINGTSSVSTEDQPEIIVLEDGRIAVAWVDDQNPPRLLATILDPVGNVITPPFELSTITSGSGFSIAATRDNGFAVAWQQTVSIFGLNQTNVGLFDADGMLVASVPSVPSFDTTSVEVVALNDGSIIVGSNDQFNGNQNDVQFTRFDENLNRQQSLLEAQRGIVGEQTNVQLAVLENGRIVSVFQSDEGIATQQAFMSVTTVGATPVDLQLSAFVNPLATNNPDPLSRDTAIEVTISSLPDGTQVLVDGSPIGSNDGVFNITGQDFDSISLVAPDEFNPGTFTGQLSVTTNHSGDEQTEVADFAVVVLSGGPAAPINVSGFVAQDTDVDGSVAGDGGFEGVEVSLLRRTDGDRFEVVGIANTVNGLYAFTNLDEGVDYIVSVDSNTGGLATGNTRAQQTFSSAGGITENFHLDLTSTTNTDGFLIGGADAQISDDFSVQINEVVTIDETLQHGVFFTANASDSSLDNIDFGFNFNVVTHVDDDENNLQGSLRQFIVNANEIAGGNRLMFVPGVEANPNVNGERWWTIGINDLLPTIQDDMTIIDGRAWQAPTDGSNGPLVRNNLNQSNVNDPSINAVGVDSEILGDATQFSISNLEAPDLEIVNTSGEALEYGLRISPGSSSPVLEGVEITNIAIHGFGNTNVNSGNIVVDGRAPGGGGDLEVSGFKITESVIGAGPDLNFVGGVGPDNVAHNIVVLSASGVDENSRNEISNNLIVSADRAGIVIEAPLFGDSNPTRYLLIEDNVIRDNGQANTILGDGIDLRGSVSEVSIVGNYISNNSAFGIDSELGAGDYFIRSNTISNNGTTTGEAGGIRLGGTSGSQVIGNSIVDNLGSGVNVSNLSLPLVSSPSNENLISKNEFLGNEGIAIDLVESRDPTSSQRGDGVTLTIGRDQATGNDGIDSPEIESVSFDQNQLRVRFSASGSLNDANGNGFLDAEEIGSVELYLARSGNGDSFAGDEFGEGAFFIASAVGSQFTLVDGQWELTIDEPSFGWPNGGFAGTDSITAIAIDDASNTSEFGRNVGVNHAPTTSPVTLENFFAGGELLITEQELLVGAEDVDDDFLSVSNVLIVSGNGTLVDNFDGTWTYTAGVNDAGQISFSYEVSDGAASTAGSATSNILLGNVPPTTMEVDLGAVSARDSFVITEAQLLSEADDPNGDELTLERVRIESGGGSLVDNFDGTWTYTPSANEDTEVSFSYRITDGVHNTNGSAVLDVVAFGNTPPVTSNVILRTISENGSLLITEADLLINASDADGDRLRVGRFDILSGSGTLVDNSDRTWTYTPAINGDAEIVFTYIVRDGMDNVDGSATLMVNVVNDAPTNSPVTLTAVPEGTVRTIAEAELLANASDVDGDPLSVTGVMITSGNGSVVDNGDGTWAYTPEADDDSEVVFSYEVTDGQGGVVAGSATLDIIPDNVAPTSTTVELTPFLEDNDLIITEEELLEGASDDDGDPLSVAGLTIGSGGGNLVDNGDGTWTYTPDANDDSNVVFSYQIVAGEDSVGNFATVDILPVNDAPTNSAVGLSDVVEDNNRIITEAELLANAGDIDGDALSVAGLAISSGNGTLVDNGDDTWTYTPAANDDSEVVFSYEVTDGQDSVAGSATLDILPDDDAPTNSAVTLTASLEDTVRTITEAELLINANDVDGDALSVTGLTISSGNGNLVDNGDGTWTYTPEANDDSEVVFSYEVTDGRGSVAGIATLDILPVNDAPTNSAVTLPDVLEDTVLTITEAELLANAGDIDGETLSVAGLAISSGNGNLVDNGDGTWTYTPDANDDSQVVFSYEVTDGQDSVAGSATLDILPVNDAPTIPSLEEGVLIYTEGDAPVVITTDIDIEDVDSPNLEFARIAISSNFVAGEDQLVFDSEALNSLGISASFDDSTGVLLLTGETSASNYQQAVRLVSYVNTSEDPASLTKTISYTVSDDESLVSTARSRMLQVVPVNDLPTNSAVSLTASLEDLDRIITEAELLANASDIEGDALSVTGLTISSGNGSLVDNGDGTWTYTPAANDNSEVVFSYEVTDGQDSVAGSAMLDILPVDDAPTTSVVELGTVIEDSDRTFSTLDLLANANDVDNDDLSVTNVTVTSGDGTLVDNLDGTFTYSAADEADTEVSFSYEVTDGTATVEGSATLDVTSFNNLPTLNEIETQVISEGDSFTLDVLAVGMAADAETQTDDLKLVIVGGQDADLFRVNPVTNELELIESYIVPAGQDTDLEVLVAVDDRIDPNDGTDDVLHRSIPRAVVVTVENVDDAPVFVDVPTSVTVTEDQAFISDLSATDQDLDEITFRLEDPNDGEFFEIDPTTGVLQFRELPNFENLGLEGRTPFEVEVAADDNNGGSFPVRSIIVSISDFTEPSVTSTTGPDLLDDSNGDSEVSEIIPDTLPPVTPPTVPNEAIGNEVLGNGPQASTTLENRNSGVDDFNSSGEIFNSSLNDSDIDLGFYESRYQGVEFIQETELVSQQLADTYSSRGGIDNLRVDDTQLAALFWQSLDSSNEAYLQRNLDADSVNIVATSAGLFSAGLLFSVYGGSIAITTLATQLPAWKSLDISPLISAFDEDEESIHEIVDG